MRTSKLSAYRRKRDFKRTHEPRPTFQKVGKRLAFVVQEHRAAHLHYDFRLELDGVLKSWAVPKGPSLDPAKKRLAIRVEDHPYAYRNFQGVIPKGNYGAGEVIIWDRGSYRCQDGDGEDAVRAGFRRGSLSLKLSGKKLKGGFSLVRLKPPQRWLLIKKDDSYASARNLDQRAPPVKSRASLTHTKRSPQRRKR